MDMKYYIYFLRNKSKLAVFAWLIRLAIKRPYNHVEIVVIPKSAQIPVRFYGAVSPVSRLANQKYINSKYDVIKIMQLRDFNNYGYLDNIKYLDSMCGRRYSAAQIVLQLIGAVSYWAKRALIKSKLNYDHLLICTELAARFMGERMGYKFEVEYDACEFEDLINTHEKSIQC